ncbi:MAG: ZIP family metal transporter [Patescibacteria group bacterium]|nr:ZIP family metal transporter [Patescibacteria group bacterium]
MIFNNFLYIFLSVFFVSLLSFAGILTLTIKKEKLKNFLIYFVSFSAGALLGDVFIHLLPELIKENGFTLIISFSILSGILFSFILEKIICWRHCHMPITKNHIHPFVFMNLWGDFFHNIIDGLTIASAYFLDIKTGIATTLAVIFHEIPQEIGDFGVLVHGGFKIKKALFLNFLTALSSIIGALIGIFLNQKINNLLLYLVPFAAGNFIYIAGSDLIPELHKEVELKKSIKQILAFIFGILIMYFLLNL